MELEFNKIYVVESLPDSETKTGKNLHNDIIERKLWSLDGYKSKYIPIDTKKDFFIFFENVKKEIAKNNVIPFFHFEIHGNPNGFVLKSGEQVTWEELHHRWIEVNTLVNLKVWVSLATCYGAYMYSIIKPINTAPFYAYIGAWDKINIMDLQVSFERFFDNLLDNFDVNKAMEALNLDNPNLPVEYKLYAAQDVFEKVYDNYEEIEYQPDNFKKRVEYIANLAIQQPENERLKLSKDFYRKNAKRMLIDYKEFYKKKYMNTFFMTKIYPENSKRFNI